MTEKDFIPALRFSSLNNLYDRFALWAFQKTSFHLIIDEVRAAVGPKKGDRLLDLGCGPGRLAIRFKKKNANCHVTAIDRDSEILKLAEMNAQKAGVKIKFVQKDLAALNLPEKFDCIYSTFVFHHLPVKTKGQALKQLRKILKPGGRFVLADFCRADGWWDRLAFLTVQLIDGFTTTSPHAEGWLEKELARHFPHVEEKIRISTFLGSVGVFVCFFDSKK